MIDILSSLVVKPSIYPSIPKRKRKSNSVAMMYVSAAHFAQRLLAFLCTFQRNIPSIPIYIPLLAIDNRHIPIPHNHRRRVRFVIVVRRDFVVVEINCPNQDFPKSIWHHQHSYH